MKGIKKYFAAPLFFVYFFAVTGVIVQTSCCMDTEAMQMASSATPTSNCCTPPTVPQKQNTVTKGCCCHHITVVVKTIHDQLYERVGDNFLKNLQQVPLKLATTFNYCTALYTQNDKPGVKNSPPGVWQNIPLYKLHQRFTYYG